MKQSELNTWIATWRRCKVWNLSSTHIYEIIKIIIPNLKSFVDLFIFKKKKEKKKVFLNMEQKNENNLLPLVEWRFLVLNSLKVLNMAVTWEQTKNMIVKTLCVNIITTKMRILAWIVQCMLWFGCAIKIHAGIFFIAASMLVTNEVYVR